MIQTVTEEAIIIYDPVETVFDVMPIGGDLVQSQNTITGEYSPDRTLTPMVLEPSMQVVDHNITSGSKTSDVTDRLTATWYRVTESDGVETETEIDDVYSVVAQNHADYELYGKGLMVNANVPVGSVEHLRLRVMYVNTNTNEPVKTQRDFKLMTQPFVEFNPAIEVNIPNYTIVSPFKLTAANRNLAITAKFLAGALDISANAKVTFLWEKLQGTAYRAIAATDVEVVSIVRNVMTVNLDCVGRCKYRVTAWHTDYSAAENRRSYLMTLNRQMSGVNVQMQIVRGKFLKMDTKETEARLVVTVNSNELANPEDYFRTRWFLYKQRGSAQEGRTELGWGNSVVAGRGLTGTDRSRVPTFEMQVRSLSEYQLLLDENDEPITEANGEYVVGQVIENLT